MNVVKRSTVRKIRNVPKRRVLYRTNIKSFTTQNLNNHHQPSTQEKLINQKESINHKELINQKKIINQKNSMYHTELTLTKCNDIQLMQIDFRKLPTIETNRPQINETDERDEQTRIMIFEICNLIQSNPTQSKKLYDEFTNLTNHTHGFTEIDVTLLLNKYNIQSNELFFTMYNRITPFGMGHWGHLDSEDIKSPQDAQKILELFDYCIDYYNGKPIKNNFRKNNSEKQTIRIKKFDDRTYPGCFYKCILSILNEKMKK